MFSLSGKSALVTGAARGIGFASAHALAEAGARVMLSDIDGEVCAAAAAGLRQAGYQAHSCPADAAEATDLDRLVDQSEAEFGGIDILVCNAGITGFHGPMEEAPEEDFEKAVAVNLRGPLRLCNRVAPQMAARGSGAIVLMSSLSGLRGNTAIGSYALTKAALAQLARNLAVRWGPQGVRANAISPGAIDTRFAEVFRRDPALYERRMAKTPLRRLGRPEEVAAAVVFLSAPAGGFVTGHNLVVDGGTLITD